jgi:hypothetical protein
VGTAARGRASVTPTVELRLQAERRLLAALFLWPRAVDLEPRHFLAPEHGALFEVLDEARRLFPAPMQLPPETHVYDDTSLPIIVWLAHDHARDSAFVGVHGNAVGWAQWVRHYITHALLCERVTARAIGDLVEQVRECPRCGR